METVVRWTPYPDDARVATMAAEKAILCVLFEEFSEPDETGINMCLILQNMLDVTVTALAVHSYAKHLITIVYAIWYINKLALQWIYKYKQLHHHVDMLYCYYKTLTTNMSSNILNCCIYQAAADTLVNDFTWTHCVSGLFNTAWFIYMLLLMRNMSQSPLHTVSRKHVVQPRNHSKTLCTGLSMNVSQVSMGKNVSFIYNVELFLHIALYSFSHS